MSRTFAHRPFWAWLAVPSACVEIHDHRDGPCDLPSLPDWFAQAKATTPYRMWRTHRCVWDVDLNRIPPLCACQMCSETAERKADRRRDRRKVRAELRRLTG